LIHDGVHGVSRYEPTMDKIMRLHNVSSTIENGFVHLPEKAEWLPEYLHELTTFPKGKHDDQADSTSQALDWVRQGDWAAREWRGLFLQARVANLQNIRARVAQRNTASNAWERWG
jgi:hypothetical protein